MPRSNSQTYLGNPKLKKAGVQLSYTLHELQEIQRCAQDPIYFIRNYVKIVHVDRGEIPFNLYPFQEKMVRNFLAHRFNILKLPRQCGKSTTSCAFLLWTMLFKDNQNIAILANKEKTSIKLLSDLKKSYMALPIWLQSGVVEWNKKSIDLENGCKLMASSTSSDAIRGHAFNILFLDEFAFVPQHIADEFFNSVYPTISSGDTTQVIIVSTPKGMNKFHKMWVEANNPRVSADPEVQWNGYEPLAIQWNDVPGRDEQWRKDTIKRTSEEQFNQEFNTEFIGSSNTLISPTKLNALTWKTPVLQMPLRFSHFMDNKADKLEIHERPRQGAAYVLCGDVAGGNGLDYSAFVIFDVTKMPYKVVAKYRSNLIQPMLLPDVIVEAASLYNMAFILMETIDNDVARNIHAELEYDNLITTRTKGSITEVGGGFGKNIEYGLRTNKATKRIGCLNLKTLLESDQLIVEDYQIVNELTSFVANTKKSFSAEDGKNDDLAMCLVLFSWLVTQRYFKDMTDLDVYNRIKQEYDESNDEDLVPFGFITSSMSGPIDDDLPPNW